jgi:uncharacterized membrane protein YebE (DUF533 family)
LQISIDIILSKSHDLPPLSNNGLHRKTIPQGGAGATPTDNPRSAQLRAMFSRLAGADGEVDSEELQDILTASLSKGESKITYIHVHMYV